MIDSNKEYLSKVVMDLFLESRKRHLIITGSKKSGKTTLCNQILKTIKENYIKSEKIGGIITDVIRDEQIPPKYVILQDMNNTRIRGIIGTRNQGNTGLIPHIQSFNALGVEILERYIHSDVELVVIDEIGFLENDATAYQNKIFECLEQKSSILVLRKQETDFIRKIKNRDDTYIVDRDNNEL